MECVFIASWCEGTEHCAADALSQSLVSRPCASDQLEGKNVAPAIMPFISLCLSSEDRNLDVEQVRQTITAGTDLQCLIEYIQSGFPESKQDILISLSPYWTVWNRLSVDNGISLYGCRLLIPQSRCRTILMIFMQATNALNTQRLMHGRLYIGLAVTIISPM